VSFKLFKSFFSWLSEGGGYYPKLELKFITNDHRGIVSKRKIYVCIVLFLLLMLCQFTYIIYIFNTF